MKTMEEVTSDFISQATWLTDVHEPMIAAMFLAARTLDKSARPSTTLMAEYRALYNELKPAETKTNNAMVQDDLDAMIALAFE